MEIRAGVNDNYFKFIPFFLRLLKQFLNYGALSKAHDDVLLVLRQQTEAVLHHNFLSQHYSLQDEGVKDFTSI